MAKNEIPPFSNAAFIAARLFRVGSRRPGLKVSHRRNAYARGFRKARLEAFMSCPLGRVADMVGGQAANTDSLQGEFAT